MHAGVPTIAWGSRNSCRSASIGRLRHAEIDDLGRRAAVHVGDEHVAVFKSRWPIPFRRACCTARHIETIGCKLASGYREPMRVEVSVRPPNNYRYATEAAPSSSVPSPVWKSSSARTRSLEREPIRSSSTTRICPPASLNRFRSLDWFTTVHSCLGVGEEVSAAVEPPGFRKAVGTLHGQERCCRGCRTTIRRPCALQVDGRRLVIAWAVREGGLHRHRKNVPPSLSAGKKSSQTMIALQERVHSEQPDHWNVAISSSRLAQIDSRLQWSYA